MGGLYAEIIEIHGYNTARRGCPNGSFERSGRPQFKARPVDIFLENSLDGYPASSRDRRIVVSVG
jgi:hypothetical protein